MSSLWTTLADASADNPRGLWAPSFSSEGSMPTERLSMRENPRCPAFEVRERAERARDRAFYVAEQRLGELLSPARRMAGLGWPLPVDLDDGALGASSVPAGCDGGGGARTSRPGWAAVDKDMRRKGVTLALLWEEYRAAHPDGFGYSWFCEHYDAFKSRLRPTMRQSHAAGEKVFVDFAGDAIDIVDPTIGEVRPMKLFVAAMGASNYIFAQVSNRVQSRPPFASNIDPPCGMESSWGRAMRQPG